MEALPKSRARCIEKKLFVDADAPGALALVRASAEGHGVDGVQLDKVSVDELGVLVQQLRAVGQRITIIAAGGISPQNASLSRKTKCSALYT